MPLWQAGAALLDEGRETLLLRGVERRIVAREPAVERAGGRDQRGLEHRDRGLDVGVGDRVGLAGEGRLERLDIARDALELADRVLLGDAHLDRVGDRPARLLLEVGGPAVPELGGVEHGVEHGGRVAAAELPVVAERGRAAVHAAQADQVAGVAADIVALRRAAARSRACGPDRPSPASRRCPAAPAASLGIGWNSSLAWSRSGSAASAGGAARQGRARGTE